MPGCRMNIAVETADKFGFKYTIYSFNHKEHKGLSKATKTVCCPFVSFVVAFSMCPVWLICFDLTAEKQLRAPAKNLYL